MCTTHAGLISILLLLGLSTRAVAVNQIIVESKEVAASETGVTVDVEVVNDISVRQLALTLELRELTPGAFIANSLTLTIQGRVAASGLMDFPTLHYYATPAAQTCSGPDSHTFQDIASPDFVSPDAVYWLGFRAFTTDLQPGSDPIGTPSFLLTFDVTDMAGEFVIDTCCIAPAQHLMFADPGNNGYYPEFTKGIVTITGGAGDPPVAICQSVLVEADGNCEADASIDNGSYDPDGGDVTLVQDPPGPYPLGETHVALYVTDIEGFADTCDALAVVTVEDHTPPSVSCPEDTLVEVSYGTTEAVVDFSPGITDNCPGGAVVSNPLSGSAFLPGVTPVECIATDAAGNADTCVFNVSVVVICECPYQSDFDDDGFLTGLDLAGMIDILFAGEPDMQDPNCPSPRADYECDGFSTATDLSRLIDHLFAGGDGPCDPCGP